MPIAAKQIGNRIQHCRKSLGLTQAALAERAQIDTVYLSQIEQGRKTPSLDTFLILAEALRVQPGALLNSATPRNSGRLTAEIETLLKKWPTRKRKAVLQAIRILAR